MNLIEKFESEWKPNKESAKVHIRCTVNNYRYLEEYMFIKQLRVTHKNLVLVGFTSEESYDIIKEELIREGISIEWTS